jgi:hypothetical protein
LTITCNKVNANKLIIQGSTKDKSRGCPADHMVCLEEPGLPDWRWYKDCSLLNFNDTLRVCLLAKASFHLYSRLIPVSHKIGLSDHFENVFIFIQISCHPILTLKDQR